MTVDHIHLPPDGDFDNMILSSVVGNMDFQTEKLSMPSPCTPPSSPTPPSGLACLSKEDYVKERPLVCFVLLLVLVFPCLYYVSLKK